LLVLLGAPVLAPAADRTVVVGLTNSIFPGVSGARLQRAVRPFRSLFESAMERTSRVVEAGDAFALAEKMRHGKIDMGVLQGYEYAWARQTDPKLDVVVICVNYERTRKALLIVRAGSSFKKPEDLRNRVLALPIEVEAQCKLFLRYKCVPKDSTPGKFYKKIVRSTDVEEALDDVVNGKVHAAVIDRLAWNAYRNDKPGAARRLRILLESEPFPCPIIAYHKGSFSASEVKRARDWLVNAKNTRRGQQLLTQLRVTAFEAVPEGYDRIVDDVAKAYPPPKK
jgi:ABC-type phosphate/phosphonate transport system substrate-binding protein